MNLQKDKIAIQILEYWFATEFLGQDSYEACTNALFNQHKVKAYKKKLSLKDKDKNTRKQITSFFEVKRGQSLYNVIKKECEDCEMGTWGNITIYIGKVRRELCIQTIAQYFETESSNRPEKSYDNIAVASFQLTPNGQYIDHTFSLSTVIWAISRLDQTSGSQLSDSLSESAYQDDISSIATVLERKVSTSDGLGEEAHTKKNRILMPVFSEESVTLDTITKLYLQIKHQYIYKFIPCKAGELDSVEEVYGVSVQFFKNEQARDKYDEDNYLGLRHDYYSNDLKMLKNWSESSEFSHAKGMCKDLINYINAPNDENNIWERQDLINVKNPEDLELWLHEVLSLRNASLGKWPSRYTPALMQQVAINLVTGKEMAGEFGPKGNMFSVNGPPGTGKTTLLKELVADNIIEKAKCLAQYHDPDEAFEKHKFSEGEKANGGYSKYVPYWYSIKDDRINDYSLLVTSSNNTAVENITKELPLESGILNNLTTNDKDSDLFKQQLGEVEELFRVEKSSKSELLYNRKENKEGRYKEIYFSGYARYLLDTTDAWGLVAAPLGKKSNIKSFYYNVLEPLCWDFYPDGKFKDRRIDLYANAQKDFLQQLQKVEKIQKELTSLSDIVLRAKQTEREGRTKCLDCINSVTAAKQRLEHLAMAKTEYQNLIESRKQEINHALQKEHELNDACEVARKECAEYKQSVIEAQQKALSTTGTVGFFARIFNKRKCQDAENLAESYRQQAQEFQMKVGEAETQIVDLQAKVNAIHNQCKYTESLLKVKETELQNVIKQEAEINSEIQDCEAKRAGWNEKIQLIKKQCEQEIEKFRAKDDCYKGIILDSHFVADLLSSDEVVSTRAQVSNLWTTDYYNREREKLMYYALQLTREFILNSRCCRDNFVSLGQYWGLRVNEDKERVMFGKKDKEQMVGALYQTLFLLVPVISSTFASIGTLLRDIKNPGTIGTLIIDEAGQAQPQVAVGALYRSRRAVIVGDPKQVEPVVTDDLELLKKSYNEEVYRHYKDKTLSVQKCADILNPFGTYLSNGTDYSEWVGCPLLVHRRCISPMYDISNKISYGGIMKQQTKQPGDEKDEKFIYWNSRWMNIAGTENGRKDHFVKEQGEKVCEILDIAFKNSNFPDLYIISPFKSVVSGIRGYIKDYCYRNRNSEINKSSLKEDWLSDNIGTVHTFQGKEAEEVIFVLGCDGSKDAEGAVQWVNSNVVNVAVSRAKYRLYVLGDIRVWQRNLFVGEMKAIMDTFALKQIDSLQRSNLSEQEKLEEYPKAAKHIPSLSSFPVDEHINEEGDTEYSVEAEGFINNLDKAGFLETRLSSEQLQFFGFHDFDELDKLPDNIKRYIVFGIKLYYLLEPVYLSNTNLDASCCAILFCKALELQLNANFADGLKRRFPEYEIKVRNNKLKLKDAAIRDLMIGVIEYTLRQKSSELERLMKSLGENSFDVKWWNSFDKKLNLLTKKRNLCCHSQWFKWQDMRQLIHYEFEQDDDKDQRNPKIGGVFHESIVGKKL